MNTSKIIIIFIILLSFAIAVYFYPQVPDTIASHWNSKGEVDGYMSKFWGLFLMPIISVVLFLMFLIIPKIDPLKKNIDKFKKYFDIFIVILIAFLFYIYLLSVFWNLGKRFHISYMIVPALALLFYSIGLLLGNVKRNWFIGIRTPWTLSSDYVWEKTHKVGGRLFQISGAISLLGMLYVDHAIFIAIVPIVLSSFFLFVYSYFLYRNSRKDNNLTLNRED